MTEELEQFRRWLRLRNNSEKTVALYCRTIGYYFDSGEDSMAYLTRAVTLSQATRNVYKSALKVFFRFRGEQPDIDPDLLRHVRPTNQHYRIIPNDEVEAILTRNRPHWNLRAFIPWRNFLMVELLAYTGARSSELLSIRIMDVEPNRIRITSAKRGKGGYAYPPERVFQDLTKIIELGHYQGHDAVLFPLTGGHLRQIVKTLTGYRPKDFRTTYATEVARQTRDPYMVQTLLRHSSLQSAMPYIHLGADYGRKIQEVKLYE